MKTRTVTERFVMHEFELGMWECLKCGNIAVMDRFVYLDLLQTGGNTSGQVTSIPYAKVNGDGTALCTKCMAKHYKS